MGDKETGKMKDKMFEVMLAGFGLVLGIQLFTLSQIGEVRSNVQDVDRRLSYLEGCCSMKVCCFDKDKDIK